MDKLTARQYVEYLHYNKDRDVYFADEVDKVLEKYENMKQKNRKHKSYCEHKKEIIKCRECWEEYGVFME